MSDKLKTHIVIGICTCNRPVLLRQCLTSIFNQVLPDNVSLSLVLVDNSSDGNARSVLDSFIEKGAFSKVHYVNEKRTGLCYARNRILDESMALDSDWIAMLDDDEIASDMWITELLSEAVKYDADVVRASVLCRYPSSAPAYFSYVDFHGAHLSSPEWGKEAISGNVLFKTEIVEKGLRFDHRYNISGGEDTDFFRRAYLSGAKILKTNTAVLIEYLPYKKANSQWYIDRTKNSTLNRAFIKKEQGIKLKLYLELLRSLISYPLLTGVGLILSPVHPYFQYVRYSYYGKLKGVCYYFLGRSPEYYKNIIDANESEFKEGGTNPPRCTAKLRE